MIRAGDNRASLVDFHQHGRYAVAKMLLQQELCGANLFEYVWALLVEHPKTEGRMIMPIPRYWFPRPPSALACMPNSARSATAIAF